MITCKLGDKTYTVDFIAGRALREMGPALKVYSQIAKALAGEEEAAEKPIELADGLDVLVKWFCMMDTRQTGSWRTSCLRCWPFRARPRRC